MLLGNGKGRAFAQAYQAACAQIIVDNRITRLILAYRVVRAAYYTIIILLTFLQIYPWLEDA